MNRIISLLCILLIADLSNAQIRALTDNGREVLLLSDGTWKYAVDSSTTAADSLTTNQHPFSKGSTASFLVKSTIVDMGIYLDPAKWTFFPHKDNEKVPEYRFSLKEGEGYAMMITEKTTIDLENMRQIALLNAQKASMDAKEVSAEYRVVNNLKVLCLKIQGTIRGIKFVYLGYYYSNSSGTVQLVSYSSQQFFSNVQKNLEEFLNGLTELKK